MYLIIVGEKDVLATAKSITVLENGEVKNNDLNVIYGFEVKTVEVADKDVPQKVAGYQYTYTPEEGFVENPSYEEPKEDDNQLLRDALEKIRELEEAVCDLTLALEEVE